MSKDIHDYVVPYLNMESLETFLHAQGYETFSVDSNGGSTERTHGDVYGIDGRLVMKQAPISSLYDRLPKGIYIV